VFEAQLTSGLTGGWSWDRRLEFIIPEKDRKKGVGHYYIEASCNGMFGQNGENPPDVSCPKSVAADISLTATTA
jgi:hypothetical protein